MTYCVCILVSAQNLVNSQGKLNSLSVGQRHMISIIKFDLVKDLRSSTLMMYRRKYYDLATVQSASSEHAYFEQSVKVSDMMWSRLKHYLFK